MGEKECSEHKYNTCLYCYRCVNEIVKKAEIEIKKQIFKRFTSYQNRDYQSKKDNRRSWTNGYSQALRDIKRNMLVRKNTANWQEQTK